MIVKKVPISKTNNKAASIRALLDYIRPPHNQNPDEKVMYAAARGFLSDSHAAQREEMVALAAESVRSKNPVNHYILSWREGEQPSFEQVEESVTIFMNELGVRDHQVVYALHKDTHNLHLHVVINRVHPETLKVVEINRGFDIEAAHRAIAKIEHLQGWEREQNGRYYVLENGDLARAFEEEEKPRQPDQKKRDMEHRTGEKSALRIAIEEGAPIIKRAQTWEQLHRELSQKGMRYEKTGSGATVVVGAIRVKASSVDRKASLPQLEKRLGPYQPAPQQEQLAEREPAPIKPDMPAEWNDYINGRRAHYAAKTAAKVEMDKRHEQERKALQAEQKARREELLGSNNWKGKGELRSVIAAEQATERAALKERQKREREQWRQRFPPYPDFEQWLRLQGKTDLAEQWRYRASEPPTIKRNHSEPPTFGDIRNEVFSKQLEQFEQYANAVGAERYRVTVIRMREDGSKQTFILGKKDGITGGFTRQEIVQRIPEMVHLQQRGENIYYTPLSENKHHILIDDMTREKLNRLIDDGFNPAVVLESSPNNYQAIITVPKLNTPYDKVIANRLSRQLNQKYGDPNLSGAIHPHRAPGFENRKPKHQRKDGSYPEVRLLGAKACECEKARKLSIEIFKKLHEQVVKKAEEEKARQLERSRAMSDLNDLNAAKSEISAIQAYQAHYGDVVRLLRQRLGVGKLDLSRVDSMIAVRMRVTGYSQSDIESAIRHCAPTTRQNVESHDWNDYAQRTARYAYSFAGERQAERLAKYQQDWARLEGRGRERQKEIERGR